MPLGPKTKEHTEQEIRTDRSSRGFHLGDTGLARAAALGYLRLGQAEALPPTTKARGKSQLRFYESLLLDRQVQECRGVRDNPAISFKSPSLVPIHWACHAGS